MSINPDLIRAPLCAQYCPNDEALDTINPLQYLQNYIVSQSQRIQHLTAILASGTNEIKYWILMLILEVSLDERCHSDSFYSIYSVLTNEWPAWLARDRRTDAQGHVTDTRAVSSSCRHGPRPRPLAHIRNTTNKPLQPTVRARAQS